jgi:hypothetical protein
MPKFFSTVTVKMSDDDLKAAYHQYKEAAQAMGDRVISYATYLKAPYLNVYVDMKCLNCHAESREHFGDYGMDMDTYALPFPIDWCPDCGEQHLVPKDIYRKLVLNVLK